MSIKTTARLLVCVVIVVVMYTKINQYIKSSVSLEKCIDLPQEIAANERSLVHLACIMDGNRRWARKNGLAPWEGHSHGIQAAKRIIEFCLEKKIKYLTVYTLSPENFKRSAQELEYLFNLMTQEAQKGAQEFIKHGIRVRFIGDRSLFPAGLVPLLDEIEKNTAHLDTLQVNVLFCYGARQEIAAAAKSIAQKVKDNELSPDDITPQLLSAYLWNSNFPDPDLIIRTGKVSRLSNFLLYQAAYSELYMLDCFWPEVTKEHFEHAYNAFLLSKRTFGA